MNKKVLIIVGPTAVGKTGLSLALAKRITHAEIISADSRQVYKLMDIGTAKPTPEEIATVPHHFIDLIYPNEYYSAGKFGREARQVINHLLDQEKFPLVVSGSGLYIRALVDGFFEKQIHDENVKTKLKNEIDKHGVAHLYERLAKLDSKSTENIHRHDRHRIVRALEVYELTGEPLSAFQKQESQKADFEPVFIGLTRNREHLYQIIEQRVDHMLKDGLVQEVINLKNMGYHSELNSMQTVGYREVFEFLNQQINYERMVSLIKQHSRNYAKRQMTWFKKDKRINWFDMDLFLNLNKLCETILEFFYN